MNMIDITQADLDHTIPTRKAESNKDTYGRVLAICGSRGYTGAAYFAAQSAVRTGSGVVILCTPETVYPILATKLSEPVVAPISCNDNGRITQEGALEALSIGRKARAILFGCGIGLDDDTIQAVLTICQKSKVPLILDADGISALASHKDILRSIEPPVILTPHIGEFSRLINKPINSITSEDASSFAQETGAIILLKGHRTIIAAPDGQMFRNTSGNPGMAKGGSGDVLAGIILSLCGQGIPPLRATCIGAYLHGKCGDFCANKIGEYGMTPSDMLTYLPSILRRYNSREW